MRRTVRASSIGALVMSMVIAVACGPETELESGWLDRDLTIDGRNEDWKGALEYLDDPGVAVGLLNDDDFLYLTVSTSEQATAMQMIRAGTTIWFDSDGGDDKTFGIRFPVGVRQMVMSGEGTRAGRGGDGVPDPAIIQTMLEISTANLDVLGRDNGGRLRFRADEAPGLLAKVSNSAGTYVYELRMPLRQAEGFPHAIGTAAGRTIGITFETGEIDSSAMSGGRGGGRGGTGGRGGGPRPRQQPGGRPEPIALKAKVHLRSDPSSVNTDLRATQEETPGV